MKRRMVLISGVALSLVLAGSAVATGRITVKALGAFGVVDVVGYPAGHTFRAHAAPGSTVLTVEVRVPPGSGFPWHRHTSSLTVTVAQGSLTVQEPDSLHDTDLPHREWVRRGSRRHPSGVQRGIDARSPLCHVHRNPGRLAAGR